MYDSRLEAIIQDAFLRIPVRAWQAGPTLGEQVMQWTHTVTKSDRPETAFVSPRSFPMLLLPWFAELSLHGEAEPIFQADLVYSTANGYYYIRLMDNVMDGHGREQVSLLPILSFFHTEFQNPYRQYFESQHRFWEFFNATWLHSAEVTLRDAGLTLIDQELFVAVSAQKTCAAKIPLAAVFYRYEALERMQPWMQFVDLFGCWHQMWNDLFSWVKDTQYQTATFFLSEARRRKNPNEPLVDWVIREGFDWGVGVLDSWMEEMEQGEGDLESPLLTDYLRVRKAMLENQVAAIRLALANSAGLLAGLKQAIQVLEP